MNWDATVICVCLAGLEQCKARGEGAVKEENDDDAASKDLLIKRKVPAVMVGQAISVVGGYAEKASPEVPAAVVKRLPEPILPSAQTKWVQEMMQGHRLQFKDFSFHHIWTYLGRFTSKHIHFIFLWNEVE